MFLIPKELYLFPNHNLGKPIVYGNKRFLKVISYNYIHFKITRFLLYVHYCKTFFISTRLEIYPPTK